jgi:hypothetical protein
MLKKISLKAGALLALAIFCCLSEARAITIQFDYTYDTNNFFSANPNAKTDLDAVAQFYNRYLSDSLDAITPTGTNGNYWRAYCPNPSSTDNNKLLYLDNLTVAQNTLIVYVGGLLLVSVVSWP